MENMTSLVRDFLALSASYRDAATNLFTLASRTEAIVEQMRTQLPTEEYLNAMNYAYLIEDVNAMILDEKRPVSNAEQQLILCQLDKLEALFLNLDNESK